MLVSSTTSLTMKMSRERERERERSASIFAGGVSDALCQQSQNRKKIQVLGLAISVWYRKILLYMCCTVVLYYYLHDIFFLEQGVEPEGFLRGEVEKILYYLLLTLMLLLYSSVNFFITQTQDGLWNIVHSTFMFFHIPYDDVKEGTTYIHRPSQI